MICIYLAGPVLGCDKAQANDWRKYLIRDLEAIGIRGVSPLRCEPLIGKTYGENYNNDPRFGTSRAIKAKNLMDVRRCDLTLAYFPYDETERLGPSLGTVCELSWAHAIGRPTILVSTHQKILKHPVIDASTDWVLSTLDEAFETIDGLFHDYAHRMKED